MLVSRPSAVGCDDDGFTIIEVLVSIAVISITMLSLGPLFVISMRVNHQQSDRQSAIQAADDAMERARALQVSAMLTGRDLDSTTQQAVTAPDQVKALLVGDQNNGAGLAAPGQAKQYLAYDKEATTDLGKTAILPTVPNPIKLSGVEYRQSWYIGKCGRPTPAEDGQPENASRACVAGQTGSGYTPMYRVVVAVGWAGRFCPTECVYVSSSLISSTTQEPMFSIRDSIGRVKITSTPTAQTGTVTAPVTPLPFTADGSQLTWRATGLPAGLTIGAADGVISGTPTAAVNATNVQVVATDVNGQEDYVTFSWIVKAVPTVSSQANLSTPGGAALSRPFTVTNGTSPYTWSFTGTPTAAWPTGTPPGLSIDAGTGTVSGTPTVAGSTTVTVTVWDKHNVAGTRSFVWTVPALGVSLAAPAAVKLGTAITPITPTATGGIQPYRTWSAGNLPTGLSIDPATGTISGTPTGTPKTYSNVVISVTDSSADATARTASRPAFSWQVKL